MYKIFTYAFLLIFSALLISCNDDEDTVDEDEEVNVVITYEGTANINPANFPEGAALDLSASDTGRFEQLDNVENFEWDIMIRTFRTGEGGRPGVFLFGDTETEGAVEATNISATGPIGNGPVPFNDFQDVRQRMQDDLAPDGVFDFDPQTDIDGEGKPDAEKLKTAYEALIIGDKVIRREPQMQPIFLVKDRAGDLYKFQFGGLMNGGNVRVRWGKFEDSNIE